MSARREAAWCVLLEMYPRWDLPETSRPIWDVLLSDIPDDALFRGAVAYAQDSKFPPTVAEWRAAAKAYASGAVERLTAAEAWDEMYRNRHARYRGPVAWSCEAVERAARAVRWDDPLWETEQLPTIRAQFERYYLALADKAERIERHEAVDQLVNEAGRGMIAFYGKGYVDPAEEPSAIEMAEEDVRVYP